MVRSWWPWWLGHFSSRSWIHIRPRYLRDVQPLQWTYSCLARTSACHGRLQLVSRQKCGNNILGSQLLLPLRKPSGHNGIGRRAEVLLLAIWPRSQARRTTRHETNARLFPLVTMTQKSSGRENNLKKQKFYNSKDVFIHHLYQALRFEAFLVLAF